MPEHASAQEEKRLSQKLSAHVPHIKVNERLEVLTLKTSEKFRKRRFQSWKDLQAVQKKSNKEVVSAHYAGNGGETQILLPSPATMSRCLRFVGKTAKYLRTPRAGSRLLFWLFSILDTDAGSNFVGLDILPSCGERIHERTVLPSDSDADNSSLKMHEQISFLQDSARVRSS